MLSNIIEIIILSLIQGVSEFIPVSSSAHLILASSLYEFKNQSLLIDISLHLGSLLAILYFFKNDFFNFNKNKNLFYKIIISSIPLIIIGYFVYTTNLIDYFRNIKTIAWATLFFGILLYLADKNKFSKKLDTDFNIRSILVISLFQALSLIPGVSRAGITITAGRILGFDRTDSTKISFYLSIPALAGASTLGIKDVLEKGIEFNILVLFSIIFSFLFSYLTIKYFLAYVKKFTLNIFVYYRVLLAGILLIIVYS